MNNMKKRLFTSLAAAAFLALGGASLGAATPQFSAALDQKVLPAGLTQHTYLRVSITGQDGVTGDTRLPLNVALVIDQSGSMEGEKLAQARQAAKYAVSRLDKRDTVSIVTFESNVRVLLPATRVSDIGYINRKIDSIDSLGSTALFGGVSAGAAELRKFLSPGHQVSRVILISDGQANVGPDTPSELAGLGRSLAKEGISVSTIGLGEDYNEDLMSRLALASDGNHAFVARARDLVDIFDREFKDVLSVALTQINIEISCLPGFRPIRVLGHDSEIIGNKVIVHINQVYARQEKYVILELEAAAAPAGAQRDVARVLLTTGNSGYDDGRSFMASVGVNFGNNDQAEKSVSPEVRQSVLEQKTLQAQEEAVNLRDQGNVQAAKDLLNQTSQELQAAAAALGSDDLLNLAKQQAEDATKLDESDWNAQRKEMRANQAGLATQNAPMIGGQAANP